MNLLDRLGKEFEVAAFKAASTAEEIAELKRNSVIEVPHEYIELIKEKTDIEIGVLGKMYIRIWGADYCTGMNEAHNIPKYLPNALAIGDDEGGYALVYLQGNEGFGLYLCGFGGIGY